MCDGWSFPKFEHRPLVGNLDLFFPVLPFTCSSTSPVSSSHNVSISTTNYYGHLSEVTQQRRMNLLSAAVKVVGHESTNKKAGKSPVPTFRGPEIDLLNSEGLLDNLLPIGGTFHSEHFKRNPVVVRGNKKRLAAVKELLFNLDIAELVKNTASERIHIWLSQNESGDALESISIEDHSQAIKLYGAGHSIYCRAPAELERCVVPKLLNDLGLGITGSGTDRYRRGEIEMFLSRKGHNTGTSSVFMLYISTLQSKIISNHLILQISTLIFKKISQFKYLGKRSGFSGRVLHLHH